MRTRGTRGTRATKGGRPRSVQAQQDILAVTLSSLATEGFEGMNVDTIAAKAGVGKQTIYRWWPSKEALAIGAIKSLQQTHDPVVETGSLREDFLSMATNMFQTWSKPAARGLVLHSLAMMKTYPRIYRAFHEQVIAPRLEQLTPMIQRAQARGEVRQDLDAGEIIGLLAGPFWYHLIFNAKKMPPTPELAERIVDAVLQGIVVRGAAEEETGTLAEKADSLSLPEM